MKYLKTPIAIMMLVSFFTIGVFGFTMMQGHHHEPGCPFMPGEKAICSMNVFDHISAWQSTFTGPLPTAFLLLLILSVIFLAIRYLFDPPNILLDTPIRRLPILGNLSIYQCLLLSRIINPRGP